MASTKVLISFGHRAEREAKCVLRLLPGSKGLIVSEPRRVGKDAGGQLADDSVLRAGGGRIEAVECEVSWPAIAARGAASFPFYFNGDAMWKYLFAHGTQGQVERLGDDPALTPGAPVLTVQTSQDGTQGFSIGLLQLLRHKALWLPEHHAFVTLADAPADFSKHLATLKGERTLDRIRREPESTLADFTARWTDMGNPDAWNKPWETHWLGTRGHIVPVVGKHGSIYKFGIDRWAGIRPDFASPHKFRFDPVWLGCRWSSQRLTQGLPILVTRLEKEGQRCELEQFAAPRSDGSSHARGEAPMMLLTRATFSGAEGPIRFGFVLAAESKEHRLELQACDGHWRVVDRNRGLVWLVIEPGEGLTVELQRPTARQQNAGVDFHLVGRLASGKTRQALIKLLSPPAPAEAAASVVSLDVAAERSAVIKYWENWLVQGAQFEVPEPKVNELFRANLWHSLRLPRFRIQDGRDWIDLPYSNFAYGQSNADWPINQAVYVDYMLYGLRGHFGIAEEEFAAMFQMQQRANGRIGGYADWGVYTPSMLYSIGQNFLLSHDRASLERLLPAALRSLGWCLAEVAKAQRSQDAPGLIVAPLNDLTHDAQAWAFPNAYFVAGLAVFGRALAEYGHPRAAECLAAAEAMRRDVQREFARGSVRAAVVPLADGTWSNFVPSAATRPRRLFDQWYPTDVDTGPLHLARLGVIDPRGWLATSMLHDHEDNLFLNRWGAANEPVYNPQGTAYLLRDEPEAAIRTFYSTMACAFSHGQLEPVEHRWAWGQYFGPPSTDGAWFELYRRMLIHEWDDGSLRLCQAVPRKWLEDGNRIRVERAPTYYGPIALTVTSRAASSEIEADVELPSHKRLETLLVRFRHPNKIPMRSVTVNGRDWMDFDIRREWVRVDRPDQANYSIVVRYAAVRGN